MENFKKLDDGSILCIPMGKKFSLLTAKPNWKDIFDGSYKDEKGDVWVKWITYFTGVAARREIKKQHKKILKDETEVWELVECFPSKKMEQIYNFIKFFWFGEMWFLSSKVLLSTKNKCRVISWTISYEETLDMFKCVTDWLDAVPDWCWWWLEACSNLYCLVEEDAHPIFVCEDY